MSNNINNTKLNDIIDRILKIDSNYSLDNYHMVYT